jgi:hypothetical protein
MTYRTWTIILGIALTGALGCSDQPVTPTPVKYNIYLSHYQNEAIYIIDADSLTIIDSIPDIRLAWDIESSPDGRWLYVQTAANRSGADALIKFDMTSKKRVTAREGIYTDLTVLNEGGLILRHRPLCADDLPPHQLLNTDEFELIEEYDDSLCRRSGPSSGSWVAATLRNESKRIRAVNVRTNALEGTFQPRTRSGWPVDVTSACLHPNRKWVLLDGWANGATWAVIGDIESDSCVFDLSLASVAGSLAISSDGRWGVVTDPSRPPILGEPARVNIIDFETMQSSYIEGLRVSPVQARFLPKTDIVVLAKEHRSTIQTGPISIELIAAGEGKSLRHARLNTESGRIGGIGVGVRFEK